MAVASAIAVLASSPAAFAAQPDPDDDRAAPQAQAALPAKPPAAPTDHDDKDNGASGAPVGTAFAAQPTPHADRDDDDDAGEGARPVTEVVVTARRLDNARASVEPSLGASTYALSNDAVENRPSGETTRLSQVLLQAPGVAPDGAGQLRVRSSTDLQYRINNVILPEGLTDIGESLSARMADRVELITGALPAQYGLQVGGIVNVTTKSGVYQNGGQAELYGGSHGEIEPAFEFAGSAGRTNVFVSGSYLRNDAGLNSPDGSPNPLHDHTDQIEGFAFIDHVIDAGSRISVILGMSNERFEMPHAHGLNAATYTSGETSFQRPLDVGGVNSFPSERWGGSQSNDTQYGIVSYLRTTDRLTLQASAFARHSTVSLRPDDLGDLLFTGLGLRVANSDVAAGVQFEGAYNLSAEQVLRAGVVASWRREISDTRSLVLPIDAHGRQISDAPATLLGHSLENRGEGSLFVQDEWRLAEGLTLNLGLRFDQVSGKGGGGQVGPRVNLVWVAPTATTLHAGYARYFVPAPGNEVATTPRALVGTTGMTPSTQADPLRAETDDYFDVGVEQKVAGLTVGLDGYWRNATNLIDQTPIGASTLTRAFNFATGKVRGVELSATYTKGPFSAWSNVTAARAEGRRIVSSQFDFTPVELTFIDNHFVRLDGDQTYTVSAGASYKWRALRLSTDMIYGSGLPRTAVGGAPNGADLTSYVQINFAAVYRAPGLGGRPLDLRLDLINAFDRKYQLRDGTGIGEGVPQWGPRRGIFIGLEQSF